MGDIDQGIVHVIGPAARADPARPDDRLRRLAHLDPRRVRRAGVRHRHQRGRARAGHPDAVRSSRSAPWPSPSRGRCRTASTAKDLILAVIARIGTGGGQGYVIEYRGEAVRALSMEARMTVCNMSIEAGARAGMIAPDETTFEYLQGPPARAVRHRLGRRGAPPGASCTPTTTRRFDHEVVIDARRADPVRHLGDQPRPGPAARRSGARAGPDRRRARAGRRRAGAGVHGPDARHAAARDRGRHRLRRLLHQRPDRGPARGRRR